jgi:hypothetical protein
LTGAKASGASIVFAPVSAKLGETIIIVDADGNAVDGTLEVSSDTATITFTPASGAESASAVTVTSGLKDNYGVGATPMTDTSL